MVVTERIHDELNDKLHKHMADLEDKVSLEQKI